MKVLVGSKNITKIDAVKTVFSEDEILALNIPSGVDQQPLTDIETRKGAINRAKQCVKGSSNAIGIGLEGGVMKLANELYLCNWGALVTSTGKVYTASGARIVLPNVITEELKKGMELGLIMEAYTKREQIGTKEGTIGVFTNQLISRKEMFIHVVTLLKGQWKYWE